MREGTRELLRLAKRITSTCESLLSTIREQSDAIAKYVERQQQPQEPPPPKPLEGVRKEVDFAPEIINRYYSEQDKTYRLQQKTFCVGVLTLIALVVYTAYTIKMYSANKESADAATSAARTSAAALHLDQRAWVSLQRGDFKWQIGSQMIIPARYVNTGKTPAKHVAVVATANIIGINESPEFIYERGTGHPTIHSETPLMFPTADGKFGLPVFPKGGPASERLTLTRQMLAEMASGKTQIIMHGKITYKDVFGIDHWVTFCDLYPGLPVGREGLASLHLKCLEYNDIDQNQ